MTDEYEYAHLDKYPPRDPDGGLEQCPVCGGYYGGDGGYHGTVVDPEGTRYEAFTDAEPGTRLYHPSCWKEHRDRRRGTENAPLTGEGTPW